MKTLEISTCAECPFMIYYQGHATCTGTVYLKSAPPINLPASLVPPGNCPARSGITILVSDQENASKKP